MMSRHHILHEKSAWSSRPEAQRLRTTGSLIPRIDRIAHDELHLNCPPVPLLGHHALARTLMGFDPTGETFTDIDLLSKAIDRAVKPPRFHPLERDLAGLAIEAIQMQKPYIREGIRRYYE